MSSVHVLYNMQYMYMYNAGVIKDKNSYGMYHIHVQSVLAIKCLFNF